MVDDNEGLLREVSEELRRERLANLWQQYGTLIIAGLAILVAGVGGWNYWQNQKIAAAQTAGMSYETATTTLANGKVEDAVKAFEGIAKGDQGGYQALSTLQLAGAYLKQGKTKEAKAAFDRVAGDRAADPLLQDYATLQSVALNVGDADLSEVQNRLNRLVSETSPWRTNARELVALSAFHAKKYGVAKENLQAIVADSSAAAGTIQRANTLLASIAAIEVASKGGAPAKKAENSDAAAADAAKTADAAGEAKASETTSGETGAETGASEQGADKTKTAPKDAAAETSEEKNETGNKE